MGVPGPVSSAPSEGVHQLIRCRDASLVTSGDDVLELVSPVGCFLVPEKREPDRARDLLTDREQRVLDAVPVSSGATTLSIARTAGLASQEVAAVLERMCSIHLVESVGDRWRLSNN